MHRSIAKPVRIITEHRVLGHAPPSPATSAVKEVHETAKMARFVAFMFEIVISNSIDNAVEEQMVAALTNGQPKYMVLYIEVQSF
jgi:hypothetical protein